MKIDEEESGFGGKSGQTVQGTDVDVYKRQIHDWVVDKIKKTYVRMNDRYKDCKFEYQGWIK